MLSPLIRVINSPLHPHLREGHIFTKENILYKYKFSLQKKNMCPVFRVFFFPGSVGTQWPLTQKNPYSKQAYLWVVYSGTLQNVSQYLHSIKMPEKNVSMLIFYVSLNIFIVQLLILSSSCHILLTNFYMSRALNTEMKQLLIFKKISL